MAVIFQLWQKCFWGLFTWVNESLHRVPIDFAIDVEHNHLSKAFGGFLHGNGHVLFYVVLPGIRTNQSWGEFFFFAKPETKHEEAALSFDN